ncbi:hypothetical protein BDR03DRAFT_1013223 [Suillus americanus]|nr:hypothetical protein BDR03DRAFT_1013223 [Suillus americanus]
MSNTYSDNPVAFYLSPHPGSNTPEDPAKTSVSPPSTWHKETKRQLPEPPDDQKPPTERNGWKKRNDRLAVPYRRIAVGQTLVSLTSLACAMNKLPIQSVNSDISQMSTSASFLCSFWGVLVQVIYTNIIYTDVRLFQKIDNSITHDDILLYTALFRFIQINLIYSLTSFLSAFGVLFLGWSIFTHVMVAASCVTALDAVLMKGIKSLLWIVGLIVIGALIYYAVRAVSEL